MMIIGQINGLVIFAELNGDSDHNKVFPDGRQGLYIAVVKASGKPLSCEDFRSRNFDHNDLRALVRCRQEAIRDYFYPDTNRISFTEKKFHADEGQNFQVVYKLAPLST